MLVVLTVLGIIYLVISIVEKLIRMFGYKKVFTFFRDNEIDIITERQTNESKEQ